VTAEKEHGKNVKYDNHVKVKLICFVLLCSCCVSFFALPPFLLPPYADEEEEGESSELLVLIVVVVVECITKTGLKAFPLTFDSLESARQNEIKLFRKFAFIRSLF
jgi:hypothetical protein